MSGDNSRSPNSLFISFMKMSIAVLMPKGRRVQRYHPHGVLKVHSSELS